MPRFQSGELAYVLFESVTYTCFIYAGFVLYRFRNIHINLQLLSCGKEYLVNHTIRIVIFPNVLIFSITSRTLKNQAAKKKRTVYNLPDITEQTFKDWANTYFKHNLDKPEPNREKFLNLKNGTIIRNLQE
jgi:hypothetical protein